MSDEQDKPTLTRKPLGLKRTVEAGQVQQQFSHGRRNTVVVEVKRRRVLGRPGEAAPAPEVEEVQAAPAPAPAPAPVPAPKPAAPKPAADSLMSRQERQAQLLREAEEARMNALEEGRRRDEAARARAAEEEKARAEARTEQAAAKVVEPAPAEAASAEPAAEAPAAAAAPQGEAAPAPAPRSTTASAAPAPRRFTPVEAPKRPEPKRPEPKAGRNAGDNRRQSGKLTVTRALNDDEGARARSLAALKRAREKEKRSHMVSSGPREKQVRDVVVPDSITVQELANRMAEKGSATWSRRCSRWACPSRSTRRSTRTPPSCSSPSSGTRSSA
jgi:translation initiation factor IF-2